MIQVGILGLARREGTFAEVGLRSWEEAGCAAVEQALMAAGDGLYIVHRPLVIRSARAEAERILRDWCDVPKAQARCDLILTAGGTGYSSRDVMPEAAAAVIERPCPGIADLLRHTVSPEALSRCVAGLRGKTLLINLPGSAKGLADKETLTHAAQTLLPFLPELIAAAQE